MNENVPIGPIGKTLVFTDSKKIDLERDILDIMTNDKFDAMSVEQLKTKKHVLNFLDEMRFNVKHSGNKSSKDRKLDKIT